MKKDEIMQFLRNYILPLVVGIVIFNQTQLPREMADLRVAISEIQRAISDIKGDISEIKAYTGMVGDQNSGNDSDTGISIPSTEVRPMVATVDSLHAEPLVVMFSSKNAPYENQVSGFPKETVVAYNDALETEYTTEQLCKNKLLLRCLDEDIEVFFYGQLNEDGRWDGNCVINSYKDRKLIQITDAQYSDGILLNCKQIFSYTTNSERYDGFGMEVWAYSDRVNESDFNSGETWLYAKTRDFDQSFTADSITAENIYTADQFRINLETNFQLFAYYSGNTDGEYFNDQTGDAYMVYYFVDLDFEDKEKTSGLTEDQIYEKKSEMLGKIRMIYSGKFGGKGTFYDSSGKAWEIAIEINSDYMYYRGYFTDGKIPKKSVLERGYPPLSHDEVANYTSAITFNCPMNWYEASLDKGDSKSL